MKKKYDFIVMIGRFQPFHLGHAKNLTHALSLSEKVIIVLGSANAARTYENPFTSAERQEFITGCVPAKDRSRIHFTGIEDRFYQNLEWVKAVQSAVNGFVIDYFPGDTHAAKIAVLGHDKDESSWYLKAFSWEVVDTGPFVKEKNGGIPLSATKIRELLFTNYLCYTEGALPTAMYKWLQNFVATDTFKEVKEEYEFDSKYLPIAHENMVKGAWATNFYTCDAVVVQTGHILLVRRKYVAGKGLWALPGGHVNANETAAEAVIRELGEETNLKVPEKVLLGSLKGEKVFDHPKRSLRGRVKSKNCRTITVSFCFKLNDGESLPRVKASDDAEEAWWFTFDEVEKMRDQLFEDHASIIDYWVSRIEQ